MTNDEINQAVAKKLGWTTKFYRDPEPGITEWLKDGRSYGDRPLDYAGSIQAAWEIVETDKLVGFTLFRDWDSGKWTVQVEVGAYAGAFIVGRDFPYECKYTEADTAPMAICLAFLKLP